jgi:hypothetical protein
MPGRSACGCLLKKLVHLKDIHSNTFWGGLINLSNCSKTSL